MARYVIFLYIYFFNVVVSNIYQIEDISIMVNTTFFEADDLNQVLSTPGPGGFHYSMRSIEDTVCAERITKC
ncbi:MAG: hypothetical protein CMIDDMOC_00426 [Sodalis sp. Fle]|nr:MAG: hypothetical protein CMIDDMOC_00426 [Sodalis sp. Fle]